MSCQVLRDNAGDISGVKAPNGEDSILYKDILEDTPEKEEALETWAKAYTPSFKRWFGDWENHKPEEGEEDRMTGTDKNGEPTMSKLNEYLEDHRPEEPLQAESPEQKPLPSETDINKTVEGFLEKIGVSVQSVRNITDDEGKPVNAIAKADMLNKLIEVVEGREDQTTLPEEAAHFAVEMLGDNHPLVKEMMNKITGYKMYRDVVDQYKGQKAYRNEDGTVNFDKIKKEAIGKMIGQFVIDENPGDETETRTTQAMNWWGRVKDYIRDLFSKVKDNPFKTIANRIKDQDTDEMTRSEQKGRGVYYQLDESLDKLDQDQQHIRLDNSIDPVSKQKRHVYTYDGQKAKGSVTETYVDPWLKKIFRSDNRSEKQKVIDLMKAEHGDVIHEDIQHIGQSWTNDNGTLKDTQSPHEQKTPKHVYDKLNDFVHNLMSQYPEGTRFKFETKVWDPKAKVAGSIDFMAIQPNGKVDIYDWKSQEIGKGQEDLKEYKEPMYRIQLENYRKILEQNYGFTDFGKIRAVPIATNFVYDSKGISGLKDIEIGSHDLNQIPDEKNYLLPVTLKNESTGNEDMDALISKLNGIYDKISNTRYSKDELYKKREELGRLKNAMRDLQLRGKVDKLVELGLMEFNKYNEKMKAGTLTGKDILESTKILDVFNKSGTFLYDTLVDLHQAAKESDEPGSLDAYEDLKNRFLSMTARTGKLISDMEKYRDKQAQELGEANGIEKLLAPETPIGPINGLFAGLSKITQKSFRAFSKVLRIVQNTRDARFDEMTAKSNDLKKGFVEFAKGKGLSTDKAMEMMLSIDEKGNWNGNFLGKYKPEFTQLRNKAIKTADKQWLLDNLDYDNEAYKEQEQKQIEFFKGIQYSLDPQKNNEQVEKKIKQWIDYNKVVKDNGSLNELALMNPENRFLKPSEDWQSDKWKELNKPENKAIKDIYDHFQGLIRYSEKLGMLDRYSPGFIPSIHATKIDQLVFGDIKDLFKGGIFDKLEVDSGTQYTPEIDPTDGSVINRVPVYFTKDMGAENEDGSKDYSKKSRDLFKVFSIWGSHMYNYEAMQSIEDRSMILLEAERNKESLVTDRFGNIVMEGGKVKAIDNNDRNAKLLENFVNYYLYDKITDIGSDMKFKVPFSNKEFSLLKTVSSAIQFFGFKTLALNPLSGTAHFVRGAGNAFFMARKGIYFNEKSWTKGLYMSLNDEKAKAAVKWANIMIEGNHNHAFAEASLNKVSSTLSKDNAFFIIHGADRIVHAPVAIAMMMNHMVDENGKIVDISQYVKDKYNYNNNFYNLPEAERKVTMAKIDAEVKQLQDTKSILQTGAMDKDGNFSLPGIDKAGPEMEAFRSKVKGVMKKILGNVSREDINQIRTTMLGMSLMQFRNWIPDMVEERLAGLKYEDSLGHYTYGKMNMFFSELFSKRFPTLVKSIATGFGDDMIQAARGKYQDLRIKALRKGQEFNISEGEFIDLYKGNIRSQMAELLTLVGFSASIMGLAGVGSGKKDDELTGVKKYMRMSMSKYFNDFSFYYNPTEFTKLVKTPLPVIGLAEDFTRFTTAFSKYLTHEATGDDKALSKDHPGKYFFRLVPVAKQAMDFMAIGDDQFRKDWDIKLNY